MTNRYEELSPANQKAIDRLRVSAARITEARELLMIGRPDHHGFGEVDIDAIVALLDQVTDRIAK